MKFTVTTAGYFYTTEQAEKLGALGFEFQDCTAKPINGCEKCLVGPEEGIEVEIGDLDELMRFQHEWGPLLLDGSAIKIADDYLA